MDVSAGMRCTHRPFPALIVALVWVMATLMPGPAPGGTPVAKPTAQPAVVDARVGTHPGKTRFVLELTEPVQYRIATLADPHRVVIDLPALVLPAAPNGRGTGIVQGFRYSTGDGATTRLTLDTKGPTRVRESFMIPPRDGFQPRLVIDLEPASAETTPAAATPPALKEKTPPALKEKPSRPHPDAAVATIAPAATVTPPPAAAAPPVKKERPNNDGVQDEEAQDGGAQDEEPNGQLRTAPSGRARLAAERLPVIVIDPGHGGIDPGAISSVTGLYEKHITLEMARILKRQLEETGRYRVMLTRDRDVFIRLRDRVARARELNASLFVSLHADSIGTSDIRGMSIYTLSETASDREAEALAAKENRVDAIAGVDLSNKNDEVATILIDLAQRDTMNQSRRFANIAVGELGREVKLLSKPLRSAGFAVLTAADIPSVLIEMGYLSSPADAQLLSQNEHRLRLARAIQRSIDSYFTWLHGLQRS